MSMSTHIVGFRPPDEKWHQMKAIYDACTKAEVKIPDEVDEFFNFEPPDHQGVKVDLEVDEVDEPQFTINGGGFKVPAPPSNKPKKKKLGALTPWRDDMQEGFEVDVTKLPKNITVIRFYNSW